MSEYSGFFNAQKSGSSYDRQYDASDFANLFSKFISNGVFIDPANQLKVVAKSGLTVTVSPGWAYIDGFWYHLDDYMDVQVSPNVSSLTSYTVVACSLNKSLRSINITSREATISDLPINNGSTHELVLAVITLSVGQSSITDSSIKDVRSDSKYCGFVKGLIDQIDTSDLFLQFQSAFEEWFNGIKGKLGDDPATSLQDQIDNMAVIRSGTEMPSNSLGKDGDVYIRVLQ